MTFLEAANLSKHFEGLVAVDNVNFSADRDLIMGVIGPNGAGKTTLFNLISGALRPDVGQVSLEGARIDRLRTDQVAMLGIARTFQIPRIFKDLSVIENVLVGRGKEYYHHIWGALKKSSLELRNAEKLLRDIGFTGDLRVRARTLSLAMQRRLEVARGLATHPKALLVDEGFAGLNRPEIRDLIRLLTDLHENGIAIWLIEHNMRVIMSICERIIVMDRGAIIADGEPEGIRKNEAVIRAYLGRA